MAGRKRPAGSVGRWSGVVLSAMIVATACAGASSTPGDSNGVSEALPPAALPVVPSAMACPVISTASGVPSLHPAAWPSGPLLRDIQEAMKLEMAEFGAAVGNPDTGSSSPAMDAFKTSLAAGDADAIRSSADKLLGHFKAACDAIAGYLDRPGAEVWSVENRALLEGLAHEIAIVRDATIAGSPAEVKAAWDRYQLVFQDHFWQAIAGNTPLRNRVTLTDGRTATASRTRYGEAAYKAFDGLPGSAWTAGDVPAPQWIEIDLGFEATVASVRLLTFQSAAGQSDHVVTYGKASGDEQRLTRFTAVTKDRQWLEGTPASPVRGVRVLRVTTLQTPGIVGWREIEIRMDAGSTPGACGGTTKLVGVGGLMSEPTGVALAVDGDETTGWDAGGTRGPGDVRGWLRLELPKNSRPSGIRVLLGPGPADAAYTVTWWTTDNRSLGSGKLNPVSAAGGWATAPGPTPCDVIRTVDIGVTSAAPAAQVREVEILGSGGT